jgi:hypothetical protein
MKNEKLKELEKVNKKIAIILLRKSVGVKLPKLEMVV